MKKIGLLILALLLALGVLGFAYAKWSHTATLHGTISSGDVCVEFGHGNNPDPCQLPPPAPVVPHIDLAAPGDPFYPEAIWHGYKDKDVGCTSVSGEGTNTLLVTINNAYPSYYNDLEIEVHNCGTVPVKISSITIDPQDFTRALTMFNLQDPGQIWIGWSNGQGDQIEPGGQVGSSLKIHVEQPALQGYSYHFTVTIVANQWNEPV